MKMLHAKVKLDWAMHGLKTDRGVLAREVAHLIATTAAELKVQPEEVAIAWLECMAQLHGLMAFTPADNDAPRVESVSFPKHISEAIERARAKENIGTPADYVENCLHERFLVDDPVYEAAWVKVQKEKLIAKRSKRPSA